MAAALETKAGAAAVALCDLCIGCPSLVAHRYVPGGDEAALMQGSPMPMAADGASTGPAGKHIGPLV
eukprot:6406623-Amphidinium_carterae.1